LVQSEQRYVIGIDLGTTNSAVSYADLQADKDASDIKIFNVPQLTGSGEFSRLPVLPSFLYIPGEYDIAKSAISIPWKTESDNFSGAFARDHGSKVPARLVSSAKSWLCHSAVDRHARILPWGAGDEVYKVSPVEAVGEYLKHIRKAWNFYQEEEDLFLENQIVVITVPASFDEVARDLTMEAAYASGLKNITLLEEPLAAFYSWLIRHETKWHEYIKPGELILVCDVGGGTTDFTLISLRDVEGSPRFERIAVGDHLILGGDNIDLALAKKVEEKTGKNRFALNKERWKNLCHQCRQAKENILENKSVSEKIVMMGEGRSLIAGTVSAELDRGALETVLFDDFFPLIDLENTMDDSENKNITEYGLPFEQETAITKHMGHFLENHREDVDKFLNRKEPFPDLIMFNGGSLKSDIIQSRMRQAVGKWFHGKNYDNDCKLPRVLENPEPDLAVALGASYYGLVKTGKGVRVGSGSPRSYYLGIAQKTDIEGKGRLFETSKVICMVERGLDEGSSIELKDKQFEVLANQPVSFDLYSSTYRSGDRCGEILKIDDTLTYLPPIRTVITFGKKDKKTTLPVKIEAEYTEMGSISLWCRSLVSSHRWQLQFQLRGAEGMSDVGETEVFDAEIINKACNEIQNAFQSKTDKQPLIALVKSLSEIVQRPKEKWPISFLRSLSDELIQDVEMRKISPEHEMRWFNLFGYTLRPGFGDSLDSQRIKSLWKIYSKGPANRKNAQVASQWWILWRRVAGGLTSGQQRQFIQDISPIILPKKAKQVKFSSQEVIEIWMAVANMEKLLVKDKTKLGRTILDGMKPGKMPPQLFWALSRIGARELLYGSTDRVIPPEEVESWIEKILEKKGYNQNFAAKALIQMARKTGDRSRDINPKLVDKVMEWLLEKDMLDDTAKCLTEVIPMASEEKTDVFGEALPSGFILQE
jgi:molecular chaperone DnaK (HSP70)